MWSFCLSLFSMICVSRRKNDSLKKKNPKLAKYAGPYFCNYHLYQFCSKSGFLIWWAVLLKQIKSAYLVLNTVSLLLFIWDKQRTQGHALISLFIHQGKVPGEVWGGVFSLPATLGAELGLSVTDRSLCFSTWRACLILSACTAVVRWETGFTL